MNYTLIRVNSQSHRDLIPIFNSAFGVSPDLMQISNKHDTGFVGVRDVGFIAYSEAEEPAAFYGVFPLEVRIKGRSHLVAQSGDTMVDKKHERRGLFTKLASKTYELCKSLKISGVFGFPSASSYPGFVKKLSWIHNENIQRYQLFIPTFPLSELSRHLSIFKPAIVKFQIYVCSVFFSCGSPFSGSILDAGHDGVIRSDGYWKYKLNSANVKLIKVGGCDVVVKFDGTLGIGDINYSTYGDVRKVMFKLKVMCFFCGISRIVFYTSPGTNLDREFSRFLKSQKGLPIGFISFDKSVNLSNLKFCYLDMDTY